MPAIKDLVEKVVSFWTWDKRAALKVFDKKMIASNKTRIENVLSTEGFTDDDNCINKEQIRRTEKKNIRQLYWEWKVLDQLGEYCTGHCDEAGMISKLKILSETPYDDL